MEETEEKIDGADTEENHDDPEDAIGPVGNANPAAAPIFDGIFIPNGGPNILLIAEFII